MKPFLTICNILLCFISMVGCDRDTTEEELLDEQGAYRLAIIYRPKISIHTIKT